MVCLSGSRRTSLPTLILAVLATFAMTMGCGSETASVTKLDDPVSVEDSDGESDNSVGSDLSEIDDLDDEDNGLVGDETDSEAIETFSEIEFTGSLLNLPQTGESIVTDDPAMGQPAPAVRSVDFAGNLVTFGNDGPQIRIFLAHWCPHCQAELPLIVEWMEDGTIPSAVAVRAVSTSVDEVGGNYPPSEWIAREGFVGEVMVDSPQGEIAGVHGITGFPFFVAIDGNGNVAARGSGELRREDIEYLVTAISQ